MTRPMMHNMEAIYAAVERMARSGMTIRAIQDAISRDYGLRWERTTMEEAAEMYARYISGRTRSGE